MALVFLVSKICIYIYEKYTQRVSDESVATSTSNLDVNVPELKHPRSKSRLISLDAFRGLAIVTMIFCNCGAGKYRWLEHATWDGIHFADFIFPSFLWIMGVCIPISIKSQMAKNILKRDMIVNITKVIEYRVYKLCDDKIFIFFFLFFQRSLKLFVIGLCIHTMHGPKLADIRIMGVLQRFGIAYFVVASVQVFFAQPILTAPETNWKKRYLDIISLTPQWAISFVLILLYFFISYGLAVPNCPRGYLGPGGIHKGGAYNHCIGGATGYIDRLLLGQRHLYQTPRVGFVYNETLPFDPEGLVGCLLTIVQVFFGVQCGTSLLIFSDWKDRLKRWTVWGICTLICGLCLGLIPYGNAIIPINKNLWSLSYVLVTSGVAFFVLSFLYCIIDVKLYWNGKPLVYAGMNAIIMYIGSEIFHKMYPFYWHIGEMNTHFSVLLQNIWTTSTWVAVAYYLYLKNIFITL